MALRTVRINGTLQDAFSAPVYGRVTFTLSGDLYDAEGDLVSVLPAAERQLNAGVFSVEVPVSPALYAVDTRYAVTISLNGGGTTTRTVSIATDLEGPLDFDDLPTVAPASGTSGGGSGTCDLLQVPTGWVPTGQHTRHELAVGADGSLYVCVTSGSPGVWVIHNNFVPLVFASGPYPGPLLFPGPDLFPGTS